MMFHRIPTATSFSKNRRYKHLVHSILLIENSLWKSFPSFLVRLFLFQFFFELFQFAAVDCGEFLKSDDRGSVAWLDFEIIGRDRFFGRYRGDWFLLLDWSLDRGIVLLVHQHQEDLQDFFPDFRFQSHEVQDHCGPSDGSPGEDAVIIGEIAPLKLISLSGYGKLLAIR